MKVIAIEKKPIKLWSDDIDIGAIEQLEVLANLPFTYKHIAAMPDTHLGIDMPIGGILATKGVICPSAVGVDIGCGMRFVEFKANLTETDLRDIVNLISEKIPVGFKHNEKPKPIPETENTTIPKSEKQKAAHQLGTLGGGNHFIEIQKCDDFFGLMIHSGSRNVGLKTANHYIKLAKELGKMYYSCSRMPFLPNGTKHYIDYITDMNWCLQFAYKNREEMMSICMSSIINVVKSVSFGGSIGGQLDIHHNYATMENHFGSNVMIHRKGATKSFKDQLCIIPGSMGTASYICKGLGNPESFMSCSHGAGRVMGRKQAKKELNHYKEVNKMAGIISNINLVSNDWLDEAPGAYKDIDLVMENQKDLVEVVYRMTPIAVIKG